MSTGNAGEGLRACAHEHVRRTLRSVPACSVCLDCNEQVEKTWTLVHPRANATRSR